MIIFENIAVLILLFIIYIIIAMGVRKYHVTEMIKGWSRKEKVGILFCVLILMLGIFMQSSRVEEFMIQGDFSKSIYRITDVLFAGNITSTVIVTELITIVPAILFQLLFFEKVITKVKIPCGERYFYLFIYATSASLYRSMDRSIGELVVYLLISVILFYGIQIFLYSGGKKGYLYLGGIIVITILLAYVEYPLNFAIYVNSVLVLLECLVLSYLRKKTVILRKTLRRLSTLIVLVACIILNYNVF